MGLSSTRALSRATFQAGSLHLGAGPRAAEPLPIWLSVLVATACRAQSRGKDRQIDWQHVSGRATYTNLGSEEVRIEPLGVRVPRGKTVAVSWLPGETEYTVEVYKQ
jgi:hypothetical protein